MHIKTVKPQVFPESDDSIDKVMSYIENLKEEISFRIELLNKRIDYLDNAMKSTGGDSV